VSPFERIADLTFFAVQTRYDDSLEIKAPDGPLLLDVSASGRQNQSANARAPYSRETPFP
jgi:hypothetical protein